MNIVKEVCVESFDEATRAIAAGATRIELCENLAVGGTTPSYGTIKQAIQHLKVPVMVMIRPRGGNFIYTDSELEIMKEDIAVCKNLGVRGVVFGLLKDDNTIDIEKSRLLVSLARPMQITFHKAIDETPNLIEATQQIVSLGIERILSSGGKVTALDGKENLNAMTQVADNKLNIIVAGKVTNENFETINILIPSNEYHGRQLVGKL